uniref:Uncharacterized protein n=1 Tax=Arundo donax TaxID=35708 RepID=A0A0A8ZII6_ARUDO
MKVLPVTSVLNDNIAIINL